MAAGALTVGLTAAASLREFSPLSLVLPLQGSATYLASVPQFEAPSESLAHSTCSFLVESLSAYAVGLVDALWLCPECALRLFFASVSFVDPVRNVAPLAQCLCWWVLFSPMVHTLRDGVTPAGSRLVCPRSERRFSVTVWVKCVGQFTLLRDRRLSLVLRPFSLWMGFEPLSEASLRALSLRVCFLVVLAEDVSLRFSLAISSVLPCPMLWFHVRLQDTCSWSKVVLGALP